jgi:hypothetical protein
LMRRLLKIVWRTCKLLVGHSDTCQRLYEGPANCWLDTQTLAKDCRKGLQIVGWTLRHLPKIVWRTCKLLVGHSDTCQRLYEGPANCWLDTHRRITLENQSWNFWGTTVCENQFKIWWSIFRASWGSIVWV